MLDAAHIVSDKDERLGQPVVPNGIPLSKIHHAAFGAHLIGIDPDYRLHVSARLLGQNDGPMLEAMKRLNVGTIYLPSRLKDRPDRDRLAQRFERFNAAASGLSFLRTADFNLAVLSCSVAFKSGQAARITSGRPSRRRAARLAWTKGGSLCPSPRRQGPAR